MYAQIDRVGPVVWQATLRSDDTQQQIALSAAELRGAQREVTTMLTTDGWEPVKRWYTSDDGELSTRWFRKVVAAPEIVGIETDDGVRYYEI
jgi:hypothetical protein